MPLKTTESNTWEVYGLWSAEMPVTAIMNIRPLQGGRAPRSFRALFHPLFLDLISRVDAGLGGAIHGSGGMAPFSLSPIRGELHGGDRISPNTDYWVRIAMLDGATENVFLKSLEKGLWNEPFLLADIPFLMEDVILGEHQDHAWSGRKTYRELLEDTSGTTKIAIQLASPTAFKRGDLHYPLPEPGLLLHNLVRRWDLFSPMPFPVKIDPGKVSFSYMRIQTQPYPLRKGGTVLGCIGKLTFLIDAKEKEAASYGTLLRFAFFSGIGVKTAQGMGMCRLLEN